jgi:hypothetical protein
MDKANLDNRTYRASMYYEEEEEEEQQQQQPVITGSALMTKAAEHLHYQ